MIEKYIKVKAKENIKKGDIVTSEMYKITLLQRIMNALLRKRGTKLKKCAVCKEKSFILILYSYKKKKYITACHNCAKKIEFENIKGGYYK